jgi:hypothetical protein
VAKQLKLLPEYPEHEKLKALNGANQIVGDFIEWFGEKGWELAKFEEGGDDFVPVLKCRDDLIAEFFEIDQNRLEAEKRGMLNRIREGNNAN